MFMDGKKQPAEATLKGGRRRGILVIRKFLAQDNDFPAF